MKASEFITKESSDQNPFKHLSHEIANNKHIVSIIDSEGYAILRGFGRTFIEAINDLHQNLI